MINYGCDISDFVFSSIFEESQNVSVDFDCHMTLMIE